MSSPVSFRISRAAEDLAQAISALSQRLVKLEQRQESLELQWRQYQQDSELIPADEMAMLDGVDRLLLECQELLDGSDLSSEHLSADEQVTSQEQASSEDFDQSDDSSESWSEDSTPLAA
ncbi:MAG: Uncharacterised protein [Prochlorococcus marinus str. MIT 9215]|nr:MAG: Uncharacterised protein [Prochlorococcus marinus str. MIT 9215]